MSLPTTTKQWLIDGKNGFDSLKLVEKAEIPPLGDLDVLVQVHYASLNYRDLIIPKVRRERERDRETDISIPPCLLCYASFFLFCVLSMENRPHVKSYLGQPSSPPSFPVLLFLSFLPTPKADSKKSPPLFFHPVH